MTETNPLEPGPGDSPAQSQGDSRKPHGIRFSDSEWEAVKSAAGSHKIPVAEFVRDRTLEIARGHGSADPTAIPADLAPLIERTFRYTWMLATHKRDELNQAGRGEEMEKLVKEARALQDSLLRSPSDQPRQRGT